MSRVGDHQTLKLNNTAVVGDCNYVEGRGNVIKGDYNSIVGDQNDIRGDYNSIAGNDNTCKGDYNDSNGVNNEMHGDCNTESAVGRQRVIPVAGAKIGVLGNANTVFMDGGGIAVQGTHQVFNNYPGSIIGGMAVPKVRYVQVPTEAEVKAHDKEAEDDAAAACSICTVNVLTCAVLPCMHRCLCCACARMLAADGTKERGQVECPLCKGVVKKIKVVY